jgi:competence protein ComGC
MDGGFVTVEMMIIALIISSVLATSLFGLTRAFDAINRK